MPKVLHIIDKETPADMLNQLSVLAGDKDTILSIGPSPDLAVSEKRFVRIHRLLGISALSGLKISKILSGQNVDIVHVWSASSLTPAIISAKECDAKVVLSLAYLGSNAEISKLISTIGDNELTVSVATQSAVEKLIEAGAEARAIHLLSPSAEPIADFDRRRKTTRKSLGLDDGDVLITAPSPMVRYAGHKYVSWAHAIVRQIIPNIRLCFPGSGPNESHVRFFAHTTGFDDEVFFTEDKFSRADILAATDIAALCHEQDCGIENLAQAMAAGLPIVAANTPDIAEILTDQAGLLTPPSDPRAVSAAVLKLAEDAPLARKFGQSARQRAGELFDPAVAKRQIEKIYSEISPTRVA